jgi:hypothetical protein
MGKPWFRAKRYGIGAGLPVAWQGWAAYSVFTATMVAPWVERSPDGDVARPALLTIAAIAGLIAVTALRTEGGWRWRWGD